MLQMAHTIVPLKDHTVEARKDLIGRSGFCLLYSFSFLFQHLTLLEQQQSQLPRLLFLSQPIRQDLSASSSRNAT